MIKSGEQRAKYAVMAPNKENGPKHCTSRTNAYYDAVKYGNFTCKDYILTKVTKEEAEKEAFLINL